MQEQSSVCSFLIPNAKLVFLKVLIFAAAGVLCAIWRAGERHCQESNPIREHQRSLRVSWCQALGHLANLHQGLVSMLQIAAIFSIRNFFGLQHQMCSK